MIVDTVRFVIWMKYMHVSPYDNLSPCKSFQQVSSIYKDPSIGNLINIVIVKLVIINSELVRLQYSLVYIEIIHSYVCRLPC